MRLGMTFAYILLTVILCWCFLRQFKCLFMGRKEVMPSQVLSARKEKGGNLFHFGE
jgi:hypothetical protein